MRSKNAAPITKAESRYMAWVKAQPCACCEAPGPSHAHHIEQGLHFTTIPLCESCHQSAFNGIHGQRRIWSVLRKTEATCLNDTIRRYTDAHQQEAA